MRKVVSLRRLADEEEVDMDTTFVDPEDLVVVEVEDEASEDED